MTTDAVKCTYLYPRWYTDSYKTACGEAAIYCSGWLFCPYCGKPIQWGYKDPYCEEGIDTKGDRE